MPNAHCIRGDLLLPPYFFLPKPETAKKKWWTILQSEPAPLCCTACHPLLWKRTKMSVDPLYTLFYLHLKPCPLLGSGEFLTSTSSNYVGGLE